MHKFVNHMALRNSINAALQRSRTYKIGASMAEKNDVRITVAEWLKDFGSAYNLNLMRPDVWCGKIDELCTLISQEHRTSLANGRFRLGVAHKMVSLYLKYLWLIGGKDHMRPYFAVVDSGILKRSRSKENWTQVDDKDRLLSMLQKVEKKAFEEKFKSGAEWEVHEWSKSFGED